MTPTQPGNKQYATCQGVAVRHGAPTSDDGWTGFAFKTQPFDIKTTPVANADLIALNERYIIETKVEGNVPTTGITGAQKGDLVYIRSTDNALSLTTGTNYTVLGKISGLAGERACPTGFYRVNAGAKSL